MLLVNIPLGGKSMFTIKECIRFIVYLTYFLIIYDLRKIVYNMDLTPFCFDNVTSFKRIGYYMFSIAIFDEIINFKTLTGLNILHTKYGAIKGSFLMYIVLACMALVLAEIFEKAIEIKNENDLTV